MTRAVMDLDWSEIVFDLKRAGMAHREICEALGPAASESMIRQYLAGATPTHWRGELLLDLWEAKTGRERPSAPRKPAELRRVAERRAHSAQTAFMPTEHLPAVAQAYGMTVPDLLQLLHKRPRRNKNMGESLLLPGFEE
ncbi:Phage protein [Bordetella tumbae]|uniref:hypothetical protein n=1 Tax=Bordetella tumbae TaxID=1649139 RepID=UPI0039EF2D78